MDSASSSLSASGSAPIAAQLQCRLRERIVTGNLPPGTRLSEQEIADQYDLSRQPVREAFIRLAGLGLLEVRPQRGTFVTPIDMEWVLCVRFIRESVEADIARQAAANADSADHALLREHLMRQEAAPDPTTLTRLDEEFHAMLARIAGRSMVWDHLQQIKLHLDRARHLLTAVTPQSTLVDQHRAVADAVIAGDPAAAEQAIRQHLRRVLADLPGVLRLSPDYFINAEALSAET